VSIERPLITAVIPTYRRRRVPAALAVLGLFIAGLWNLGGPGVWWDEGWTMSVARNLAERGHYGRLLGGQLAPPGLEAAFPITAPIALCFQLFGVGIWQGRMFGVLCTVAALALMYYLALRLYNRAVAIGTLFVLLLMPMHAQLHALLVGRQALAEMPMLFYLLVGYATLLAALRQPLWLLPTMLIWGVAIMSKAQAMPFWALSLIAPLGLAALKRQWREAGLFGAALAGSLAASKLLIAAMGVLLQGHSLPAEPISGLVEVLAQNTLLLTRWYALKNTLVFCSPIVCGLLYALWRSLRSREPGIDAARRDLVRLALLVFSASWLLWFVLLSASLVRYLFPPAFIGAMFLSAWMADLTQGFDLRGTLGRAGSALRLRGLDRRRLGALLAILIVVSALPFGILALYRNYSSTDSRDALAVAAMLNSQTPPGARIETYESELHFLLNRSYHFPPDQVHVDLNRRMLLDEHTAITYDPLAADPDYLVVGSFAGWNGLYDPVIKSGAFHLIDHIGSYAIYERVREPQAQ
jgi:4-amino-4-deoxy-L-arabinose transferase-like glycosyltransferase